MQVQKQNTRGILKTSYDVIAIILEVGDALSANN
jgi:hypothetical protein